MTERIFKAFAAGGRLGQWAHVPEPPDPPEHDPAIPPETPPGGPDETDREVDLPPREAPDEIREPNRPPGQQPPARVARRARWLH